MATQYIGQATSSISFTGTTTSLTIPTSTTDDLLLLWVMHRDTLTAVTAGWVLVGEANSAGAPADQRVSLYSRRKLVGDPTSVSVTQLSSQRLVLAIDVYRGALSYTVDLLETAYVPVGVTFTPTYNTPLAADSFVVMGAAHAFSGATVDAIFSEKYTKVRGVPNANNRLNTAYSALYVGDDDFGSMTITVEPAPLIAGILAKFTADVPATTSRLSQTPILVLGDQPSASRVQQAVVQVLWGVSSFPQVSQATVLVLGRPVPRRVIGITD